MPAVKPRIIQTELGTEKYCTRCDDYWPLDSEFFYWNSSKNSYECWCIACYRDWRRKKEDERNKNKGVSICQPLNN